MARIPFTGGDSNVSKPVKRMRWATTRKPGTSGAKKRMSLLQRVPRVTVSSYEEKPTGNEQQGQVTDESPMGEEQQQSQEDSQSRTIYVNLSPPPDAMTEDGHIKAQYARNKIRTAKYTPLSFVPKNLWFQFHNIANVYFLFIVILSVSCPFPCFEPCLTPPDLLYLWRIQSGTRICPSDLYLDRNVHQRCGGRFSQNGAGHRAQQLSRLSTSRLAQCQLLR